MTIGGQTHFHALGAHTLTAHATAIFRFLCLYAQNFYRSHGDTL